MWTLNGMGILTTHIRLPRRHYMNTEHFRLWSQIEEYDEFKQQFDRSIIITLLIYYHKQKYICSLFMFGHHIFVVYSIRQPTEDSNSLLTVTMFEYYDDDAKHSGILKI